MNFLDRLVVRKEEPSVSARRLRGLPSSDITQMAEVTVSQVGAALRSHATSGDVAYLGDARLGAHALVDMVEELERRGE